MKSYSIHFSLVLLLAFCFGTSVSSQEIENSATKEPPPQKTQVNPLEQSPIKTPLSSEGPEVIPESQPLTESPEASLSTNSPATQATRVLTGTLLEKGTRRPLSGTNVFILPYKLKATTDDSGQFRFESLPVGPFEFVVNRAGYLRLQGKALGKLKNYTLYLEKENYGVFETTVTALADKKDVSLKNLSQEDFLKAPGAQDDPLKAIQNLPGIANQSASAQVVIQGSEPDDTRYTLNGHEIPIVFHFGGLSSIVMPQAVESVDFLSSGYGPEYGRALGGIINLRTRRPKTDRTHGLGFVDLYNAGALVEGPVGEDASYFLSGRYSYIGQVLKGVAMDNEDFDLTVAPAFSDLLFQWDQNLSPKDQISLIYLRSEDELKFVLNEPAGGDPTFRGSFYQNTQFYRLLPRWKRKISPAVNLDLSLGYGDNDILFEVGDNYFDLDSTTLSSRAELDIRFSETYRAFFGLDAQQVKSKVRFRFPRSGGDDGGPRGETIEEDVQANNQESAIYIRNQLFLLDQKLTFSPNLRLTSFEVTKETLLEPRLSLAYETSNKLIYTFATGLYYQAPQNGEAVKGFGNPDLKSEQAIHYAIGLEKDFRAGRSNGWVLDTDLFYKELKNLIVSTSQLNDQGEPLVNSNEGTGEVYGLQAQVKFKHNDWGLVGSYTYLKSTRTDPRKGSFPSEFDQTHNLNLIGSLERRRWTFSTRARFVTGKPYTPVNSGIYDNDNDSYLAVNGDFFSKRLDSFFQLDFRVDRKWIYENWILSAYLDLQNLTNQKNVETITYNYDYSESSEISGLPLLPIFGLKGEF